ncbi:AsmA-like C-terminal region-containing protein [Hymenobacter sp. DH14]|uniref:AsmA-like C-terminal region-containing protein n=1 Tax=Hymenobacter cyanobacteriorum TaxID=2926463 RepID=A0A9X1VDP4_9BACT|nr:AsmA-like C-terminal region-containing protein [Hymenobacter cyanobacteriorum]MCI1186227.1 AsmA-like C-terminal region-containing protein [Hymenobacter cyanobacteriorum]
MKRFSLRRILAWAAALLLLLVLGAGVVVWQLGEGFARRLVARKVRTALTKNSELVLAPFRVEMSPWRDFPHLTASIQHIALTDTSFRQRVPVLQVGRADLRLELLSLWRGQVQVTRAVVTNVDFRERVDSLGHAWGLRGKRPKGEGKNPTLNLKLDDLEVNNFHFSTKNDFLRSAFGVAVRQAKLKAQLRSGVLRVAGELQGELSYLRTRAGTLFEREPVGARVHYRYSFADRQGLLYRTRATLNGDSVRVSGTHTLDPKHPEGTMMNLRFVGNQPLVKVLMAALPPRFESYLAGTTSPSTAHVHYNISGLSGPKIVPHNVLTFGLRGASLQWPEPARRINRWDLVGTYDNGPGHNPRTTILTLKRCRIYSAAGQLDVALKLRNFRRPIIDGRFRGQATLPELAALLPSAQWQARSGAADVDVQVRGQLPPRRGRPVRGPLPPPLSLRGVLTLHRASLLLPARGADLSDVNVRIGLRDSVWQLNNASGVLNKMRFRASATTRNLLGYLNGQHPTAAIGGRFAVDELRLHELRELLKPRPRLAATALPFAGAQAAARREARDRSRRARAPRNKARLAATLASELIPAGLLLDVQLQCQRLLLASDTLSDLAVTVHHDGHQVQLSNLNGRMWGGRVRGSLQWPTDSANRVAPVQYRLAVHFPRLDYEQLMARLNRPLMPAAATRRPAAARKPASAGQPALRDLLFEANGRLNLDIDRVDLPEGENMRKVSVQLEKYGGLVAMPYLRFLTPEGGHGEASGSARFRGLRLRQADTDVTLRYATLDVQRLLGMIASLTAAAPDSVPTARTRARAERKAERKAERAQRPGNPSLLASGVLTAVLRVEADQVTYGPVSGSRFRLVSHLRNGEARLDNCSVDALQGHLSISGYMRSPANRAHHPTQLQVRLQDIQLPALFGTMADMGLGVLGADNVLGSLRGVADLRTDLGRSFLPSLGNTAGYLKTDIRGLELVNVEALVQALKILKSERTSHLYFEPVQGEFVLGEGQLLIPGLRLNSNLSNLDVSGHYGLSGATNLYIGLQPMKALFGNNEKRIERIQNGEPMTKADAKGKDKLTYVSLRRTAPGEKFQVRLFQRDEHRDAQARLLEQYRSYLLTQRLDTTVRMVR